MQIFYINLDERTDRKEHMEHQLSKCPFAFQRISAIKHVKGLVGCAQSHIKCLTLAKERNLPEVMILEDDAEIIGDIVSCAQHIPDCDVAVLGCVPDTQQSATRINEWYVSGIVGQTTVGYICKQHYYDTLIANFTESFTKLLETNHDNLYALDQYWKRLQKIHTWVFAYPMVLRQRPGYSDILNHSTNYVNLYSRTLQIS